MFTTIIKVLYSNMIISIALSMPGGITGLDSYTLTSTITCCPEGYLIRAPLVFGKRIIVLLCSV